MILLKRGVKLKLITILVGKILISILIMLTFIGCEAKPSSSCEENPSVVNSMNYSEDEIDAAYLKFEIDNIEKLLSGDFYGIVYFMRNNCPACVKFNEILELEYTENGEFIIYKFDTNYWRENESFQKTLDQYNVTTVPHLIKIENDGSFVAFEPTTEETLKEELHDFLNN